jgi:alpha,alpha-trehalase
VEGTDSPHVLREYALLADGERGALVGPRGDISWLCFPAWDDAGVFSALIGGRGVYAITPRGRYVWGGYYEPRTLIWRSRWVTEDNAIIESREALALPAAADRATVIRRVLVHAGTARLAVELDVRAGFGDHRLEDLAKDDAGRWRGRTGDVNVCWAGGGDANVSDDGFRLELELHAGESRDFVLVLGGDGAVPDADECWSATEQAWHERVPELAATIAPRDARHAYAILAGLTSGTGAMVAAATTGFPERAREGRNYDYRYAWIRDQSFAAQAIAKVGPSPLLEDQVRFVRERLLADGPQLKPAYTTRGAQLPDERELPLLGYPGGDALVGNNVDEGFQLDVFGESLILFATVDRHDALEADDWRAIELAADAIDARWREPDTGIWELSPDHWTHSRLICAAGLRAVGACRSAGDRAPRWVALADAITADTSARALHRSGRWQRSPSDERVDVALLLPALKGAVPAEDPRSLATLRAVEDELVDDGYAYRFRADARPPGEAEGAFLLCGFVLALAYSQQGEMTKAARWFERNRAACGPPGLLAEEFDVAQRQLRGNLPQAFVHALLLECAIEQAGAY